VLVQTDCGHFAGIDGVKHRQRMTEGLADGNCSHVGVGDQTGSLHIPHRLNSYIRLRDLEEHGQDTSEFGRLPPAQPAKDSGRHMERSHVQHRGVKADWAAKITGHCSGEAASDGRPHHQDATWTTSQSCYVMDSSWKWQETR